MKINVEISKSAHQGSAVVIRAGLARDKVDRHSSVAAAASAAKPNPTPAIRLPLQATSQSDIVLAT
jgi:hypothetical protein